ncbi:Lipase member H, partial [Fragariocoptes setiger]
MISKMSNWPLLVASLMLLRAGTVFTNEPQQDERYLVKLKSLDSSTSCFLHESSRLSLEFMNPIIYKVYIDYSGYSRVDDTFYLNETMDERFHKRHHIDLKAPSKFKVLGWGDQFDPREDGFGEFESYAMYSGVEYNYFIISTNPAPLVTITDFIRSYPKTAAATKTLGSYLGEFLLKLHRLYNYDLSLMHLVGFSLGSHVSGFAGKYVKANSNQMIGRITGLDPAGPCFSNKKPDDRLDRGDALYVDVVHSSSYIFGMSQRIGHRDVYVNGGKLQPNCKWYNPLCQHIVSQALYVVQNFVCQAVAYQCDSYKDFEAGRCASCDDDGTGCTLVQSPAQSRVPEVEARKYLAAYPSGAELAKKSQDFKGNYPRFMNKYYIKTGANEEMLGVNSQCLYHYQVKLKTNGTNIDKSKLELAGNRAGIDDFESVIESVKLKKFKSNLYTGLLTLESSGDRVKFTKGQIIGLNLNGKNAQVELKIEFMSNMDPDERAKFSTTLCGNLTGGDSISLAECDDPERVQRDIKDAFKELEDAKSRWKFSSSMGRILSF